MKIKKGIFSIFTLGTLVVSGNATELERDGWNLVSVCTDINKVDVNMNGIEEIQNQDGWTIYTGEFEENSNLNVLEAGYGYWVKGSAGTNFDGGTATIGVEKPLSREGWSLMAMCENMNAVDVNMTNINEVQSQGGKTYYSGDWEQYSNLAELRNGHGYWVDGTKDMPWRAKQGPMLVATLVDSTGTVLENSGSGTSVGNVNISNTGDSVITAITLSGTGHENFVVAIDGKITVNSGASIDYETSTSYVLTALAVNGAGNSNSVNVNISVTNEIDNVPVLAVASVSHVEENATVGTEIITLQTNGSNGDENSVDSYSIVSGNTNSAFDISNEGLITVANALDYETLKNYTLEVQGTNFAGDSTSINVEINVTDVLDLPVGFVNQMINNANEAVQVVQGNYTIKLYADYVQNVNAQSNHVGFVVNLNGTDSGLMSVQSDYLGRNMVVAVYDENGVLVGISETMALANRVVIPVVTEGNTPVVGAITHNGVTYGKVTSPNTGRVWLDRNLGASQICTVYNDEACYGDYYEWGREADGHEKSDSTSVTVPFTDIKSIGSDFVERAYVLNDEDWTTADYDGSMRSVNWSKTDGTSICPVDYRVPTKDELYAEVHNNVANRDEAFNLFLKLPAAGQRRSYWNGLGLQLRYWTSTPNGHYSYEYYISSTPYTGFSANHGNTGMRWRGNSVRCIEERDTTPPPAPILISGSPSTITESTIVLEIEGEAGSDIYVNGVKQGTVDENRYSEVDLALDEGNTAFQITLRDAAGNESEALSIDLIKDYLSSTDGLGSLDDIGENLELLDDAMD